MKSALGWALVAVLSSQWSSSARAAQTASSPPERVALVRTPENGIQPRAAVDASGRVHLVYFAGEAERGDLRYARSDDGCKTFEHTLKVNQGPPSACAIGNVRGPQLALGRNGRVHVAWNGSPTGKPGSKEYAPAPMLYTRLADDGKSFERERDVIAARHGLDGGGSVAADASGNVYVVWHAPREGGDGEAGRQVWVASSRDDGATFAKEEAASDPKLGVCPCCGLTAIARDGGGLAILYRIVREREDRSMVLLDRSDASSPFRTTTLDPWKVAACVMSTASFARRASDIAGAWEASGRIRFAVFGANAAPSITTASGAAEKCRHPSLACNERGERLVAWIEGMSWNTTGTLAWRLFDSAGAELDSGRGETGAVPVWDLVQAVALKDGRFAILY